jgi:hypothetical protein
VRSTASLTLPDVAEKLNAMGLQAASIDTVTVR